MKYLQNAKQFKIKNLISVMIINIKIIIIKIACEINSEIKMKC